MPSSEHPQESYISYLESVEQLITQFDADGPLLLFGDLNPIWDAEAMSTKPLLSIAGESYGTISFLTTTSRMCPSDALHLGPVHTFQSGTNATTIDYVVNQDAMRGVSSCTTLEDRIRSSSNMMYM